MIENIDFLWVCAKFSKIIHILANFTIGMIGNEMGHKLKCVKLYGKFINKSETKHTLRRNITATSLKIVCKNIYLVKCYDKINMNVLNLWGKFQLGLHLF